MLIAIFVKSERLESICNKNKKKWLLGLKLMDVIDIMILR